MSANDGVWALDVDAEEDVEDEDLFLFVYARKEWLEKEERDQSKHGISQIKIHFTYQPLEPLEPWPFGSILMV